MLEEVTWLTICSAFKYQSSIKCPLVLWSHFNLLFKQNYFQNNLKVFSKQLSSSGDGTAWKPFMLAFAQSDWRKKCCEGEIFAIIWNYVNPMFFPMATSIIPFFCPQVQGNDWTYYTTYILTPASKKDRYIAAGQIWAQNSILWTAWLMRLKKCSLDNLRWLPWKQGVSNQSRW